MTPDVSELLKKALVPPPEARAALAGSLLESLAAVLDEEKLTMNLPTKMSKPPGMKKSNAGSRKSTLAKSR
jgi:hypothetical protein